MKVLLRQFDEKKYYVWMNAVYENGRFRIVYEDGYKQNIADTDILAIKDDNRSEYVICNNCGTMIHNDPESIEAHFAEVEAKRDCFKCSSLRRSRIRSVSAEIDNNPDGTLRVTETYNAELRCGQSYWSSPMINTDAAKEICVFFRCRKCGVHPIEDVFTKYPDLFNKHITVDVLNAKKYLPDTGGMVNGYFEYDIKLRNTLKACVNKLGIVDHFVVKCRSYKYNVYYSAKYDKLFFGDYKAYSEHLPDHMSEAKYNQIHAKISALYKEEESK